MSIVPTITLNDGARIPQLGFGVYQVAPEDTAEAVRIALETGYRHVDTAQMYGNEREAGQGIRNAGLDRADVFVTSKLNNGFHKPDDARREFDRTLSALGSDYVDLFLIHWPLPTLYHGDFVSTWQTLEEFARDGRARSIGVSNFQTARTSPTKPSAPTARNTESPPRPGRRSPGARCWTTRSYSGSRMPRANHRPRWCCAGTFNAATSCFRSRLHRNGSRKTLPCSISN